MDYWRCKKPSACVCDNHSKTTIVGLYHKSLRDKMSEFKLKRTLKEWEYNGIRVNLDLDNIKIVDTRKCYPYGTSGSAYPFVTLSRKEMEAIIELWERELRKIDPDLPVRCLATCKGFPLCEKHVCPILGDHAGDLHRCNCGFEWEKDKQK